MSFPGSKAVDGIYLPSPDGGHYLSLAHTAKELSPWIQVNLKTDHFVYGVKIWNRSPSRSNGSFIISL